MTLNFKYTRSKQGISLLLIGVLIVPFLLLTPHPGNRHVQAQFGGDAVIVVGGVGTLAESAIAANTAAIAGINAVTAAAASSETFKDLVLDALAWFVTELVIKFITKSIISWINSGFEGSPAFVTDIEGFLVDTADQVAGEFIEGKGLGALCDPFQLDIRVALASTHIRDFEEASCTLSGVIDNIEGFFNDPIDLSVTEQTRRVRLETWTEWLTVTAVPQNNPYGAFLIAQSELEARIKRAEDEARLTIEIGRGFLSFQQCNDATVNEFGVEEQNCEIVTPGSVIEEQLNETLKTPIGRLKVADEINEIVSALLAQLTTQVFGGLAGGLRGLSRSSGGGRSSYLRQLADSPSIPPGVSIEAGGEVLGIAQHLNLETAHRDNLVSSLGAVLTSEALLLQLASCSPAGANATLNTTITPLKERLQADLNETNQNIVILEDLHTRVTTATDTEVASQVIDEYETLARAGTFHSINETTQLQVEKANTERQLNSVNAQTQQQFNQCLAGGGGQFGGGTDGGGGDGGPGAGGSEGEGAN